MAIGELIVLEGIDGSGTTTQTRLLAERLRRETGRRVVETRQPTRGPCGQFVRQVFEGKTDYSKLPNWRVMAHLFQADREEHFEQLWDWLGDGCIVVCDRYWGSGLVYQSAGAGDECEEALELIHSLNKHAPSPSIEILLDLSAEVALQRALSADHFTKSEFLTKVRELYWSQLGADRTINVEVHDVQQVHELIWDAVSIGVLSRGTERQAQ